MVKNSLSDKIINLMNKLNPKTQPFILNKLIKLKYHFLKYSCSYA